MKTKSLHKTFEAWMTERHQALMKLPPPDHPEHQKLRIQWADETETSLRALRDQLGVEG